jgi:hypothetical protein
MRTGKRRPRQEDNDGTPLPRDHQNFLQTANMEEPLSRAISYGDALVLMGYGLNQIDADHGRAIVEIAEAIAADLVAVQNSWRQMMTANARSRKAPVRRHRT